MVNKGKVVYITSGYFPYGQAYSTRIIALAKIFSNLQYSTHVIAYKSQEQTSNKLYIDKNISYQIIGDNSYQFRFFLSKSKLLQVLKEQEAKSHISFIVMSIGDIYNFQIISNFAKKNGIRIILEICEFYSPNSFKLKCFDPRFWYLRFFLKNKVKKINKTIVISTFLEKYIKCNNVLRIPTIIDINDFNFNYANNNNKIVIVYVGSPGLKKESFKNILLALQMFKSNNPFVFNIYGVNRTMILRNLGNDKHLLDLTKDCVNIVGRLDYLKINDVLRNADYSIFIRPYQISSLAGFPTKLVESLAAGTPVITNNTGDIPIYLTDEFNGFLMRDYSVNTIFNVLKKLKELDRIEIKQMRKNARETAVNYFDLKRYILPIKNLLDGEKNNETK